MASLAFVRVGRDSTEDVTNTPDCLNELWSVRIVLDLCAKSIDKDVYVLFLVHMTVAPDPIEEICMGEDLTGIVHEFTHEGIFCWGQA